MGKITGITLTEEETAVLEDLCWKYRIKKTEFVAACLRLVLRLLAAGGGKEIEDAIWQARFLRLGVISREDQDRYRKMYEGFNGAYGPRRVLSLVKKTNNKERTK